MEKRLKSEYEMVLKEIVEVRTCITEYIKMFFAVVTGAIGFFSYLASTKFATTIVLAYIPLALSYIIMWFTSTIFHKCNTHNRGCGYLRALEQERHQHIKEEGDEIQLWQSVLAPFQEGEFHRGRGKSDDNFKTLKVHVDKLDQKCRHPFSNPPQSIRWCLTGLWMIFRSTIFRSQTTTYRSWTFPVPIAFGPFIVTLFLVMLWWLIADPVCNFNTHDVIIQEVLLFHLFLCWLGLGYRMFRLCGGDRTIETWCLRTMVQRHATLQCENIQVEYLGWVPQNPPSIPIADLGSKDSEAR